MCPSGISTDGDYEGLCDMDSDDMTVAASCRDHYLAGVAQSGPQLISTPSGPVSLYCDMDDGGWTLVGKVNGEPHMASTWLRSNEHTELLAAVGASSMPASGQFASVDAVDLAVNHAESVKISSSDGAAWARWPMPEGRTTDTWWDHAAHDAAQAAPNSEVQVEGSGGSSPCNQNTVGLMKLPSHAFGYPAATFNPEGNTVPSDWCMTVGVTGDGTNGFDVPQSDGDWPNGAYNQPAYVMVWLK